LGGTPAWLGALLFLLAFQSSGSTIREVSVDEMLGGSQLLFDGRVIAQQVVQEPSNGRIYTLVTFEIIDILKGSVAGERVRLRFLGGTLNGLTLSVGDMRLPPLGERGIYFVEGPGRDQVHPFYGWEQGHLLVERDAASGDSLVRTPEGNPVYSVDSAGPTAPAAAGISTGEARGMRTRRRSVAESPMTVEMFKARLRELLREASR
jgi:hypothetical protein